MWLYVPDSTSSACVPASAGSTLASSSPCLPPGAYVTLRGRPTRQRYLSRAWRTKPWMRLLSGLTSEPSTVALGVERWIASLEATPASQCRWRASSSAPTTSGGSGPMCTGSSAKSDPLGVFSRTWPRIYRWDLNRCTMTFETWVTELRRESLQRRKSAGVTRGSDCSFWPTPRVVADRNSRSALTRKGHWSAVALAQTAELACGILPRELFSPGELTPQAARIYSAQPIRLSPQGQTAKIGDDAPSYQLTEAFLEWMMGLPPGWTGIEPVAMESYRSWLRLHGEILRPP